MQVSYEWLNEYVDLSGITPEEISHSLTMSGLEVEEIEDVKPKFTNIITAKIEKIDNLMLPDEIERNIVVIKKIKNTPPKYPRKAGMPSKQPL